MKKTTTKNEKRVRRHKKIRARLSGTTERLRLSIFRSNKHLYAQVIDDAKGITMASASDMGVKGKKALERASVIGESVAKSATAKKVKSVVFDRGGFKYDGRVKALAEAARKGGLEF